MADDAGSTAKRIRIGLTGLAFAFLFVLLGSVISRSRGVDATPTTANAAANAEEPNEPLAALGVAPGGSATDNAAANTE